MEAPCSTLRLFTAAAPDGDSQSVAEGVVHIFALGRQAVSDFILPGDHRLDGLGCQPASRIVIQMEIDRFHMRVFLQKAGEGPPAACSPQSFSSVGTPRPGTATIYMQIIIGYVQFMSLHI